MDFLNCKFNQYILHESSIKSIFVEQSRIKIIFDDGFYDKKHKQYQNCAIEIIINKLNHFSIDSFCYIEKRKRKSITRISFHSFLKMLRKDSFKVMMDYYSDFERAIVLIGNIKKSIICFKVTDIDSLSFFANDSFVATAQG